MKKIQVLNPVFDCRGDGNAFMALKAGLHPVTDETMRQVALGNAIEVDVDNEPVGAEPEPAAATPKPAEAIATTEAVASTESAAGADAPAEAASGDAPAAEAAAATTPTRSRRAS